jgi:hypothetical protein
MDAEETLKERIETLKKLNRKRFDFVLAYCQLGSVEPALKEIGMSKSWYYKFTEDERKVLENLADELHTEAALQAWYILLQSAPEAARVKIEGLSSPLPWIKQTAASDILDRTTEKRTQKSKVELEGNMNIQSEQMEQILQKVYGNRPSNS